MKKRYVKLSVLWFGLLDSLLGYCGFLFIYLGVHWAIGFGIILIAIYIAYEAVRNLHEIPLENIVEADHSKDWQR